MYYIEDNNNKIILANTDINAIKTTLSCMLPQYTEEDIQETDKDIVNFKGNFYFEDDEEYINKKEQDRQAFILTLSMTRSDFFDGMIMAFNVGETELKQAIINVLNMMQLPEIQKKKALNNYDNALNFYRKHPLFTMLSNTPIPVEENIVIQITSEQWDNFFVKTYEKNEDAYKELLPKQNEE